MLGGVLLSGVSAFGADEPPLSNQLTDLGRQALAQGASAMAETFFKKALELDPGNTQAARGLKDAERAGGGIVRVAMQDAAQEPKPAAPPAPQPARRRAVRLPRRRLPLTPRPRSSRPRPPKTSPGSS